MTGRVTALPPGVELILTQRGTNLYALSPVEAWPPPADLPVLIGPQPDGSEQVWSVTTVGAVLKHRPGRWTPVGRFVAPTPSAPEGLPEGARVFGRIGALTTLYTTLPIGVEPGMNDTVYVIGSDRRVVATPFPVLAKFGRWTAVDPAVQARTATPRPQAIPRRLRG